MILPEYWFLGIAKLPADDGPLNFLPQEPSNIGTFFTTEKGLELTIQMDVLTHVVPHRHNVAFARYCLDAVSQPAHGREELHKSTEGRRQRSRILQSAAVLVPDRGTNFG